MDNPVGNATHFGNLSLLSTARTRSISAENVTGEKGRGGMATEGAGAHGARELGQGWKVSPSIRVEPGQTATLAAIDGPGAIQHIWMTPSGHWRDSILRMYWDDQPTPSVECPVGDFFACGWQHPVQISSLAVCVNPGSGLNCYWDMPFRTRCRMTMTNTGDESMVLYYQIDYALAAVPAEAACFHAQFRRVNPVPAGTVYAILDGVRGRGHFIGTHLCWETRSEGWWGEGEVKFYLDGDGAFPTICGTGTEDYFCGSYDFRAGDSSTGRYAEFTTPYTGFGPVIPADRLYAAGQRFGMYRWHITDPVRFESDLRVTIQSLGWGDGEAYIQREDDLASVAFWYQALPTVAFPALPPRDERGIAPMPLG